jgi:hypothetical protein
MHVHELMSPSNVNNAPSDRDNNINGAWGFNDPMNKVIVTIVRRTKGGASMILQ